VPRRELLPVSEEGGTLRPNCAARESALQLRSVETREAERSVKGTPADEDKVRAREKFEPALTCPLMRASQGMAGEEEEEAGGVARGSGRGSRE